MILRNALDDERRRRTIEILKYRGAPHQKGEFPFTITKNGVEILPLSPVALTRRASDARISSGNADLDKMCGGGLYRDSITVTSGATGTGKTLIVTNFLDNGSRNGEKTILFAFEESRDQLLRNALGWGMDFRKWEEQGRLKIICQYPEAMGLEDHLLAMKNEIDQFGPSRIAVDSLSAIERVSSVKSFREFVMGLISHIKGRQAAGMFTATTTSLMGGTSVTERHISAIADTIILLRYVELMGEMRRGLAILKMRGSQHDKSIREYEIDDQGMHLRLAFRDVGGILAGTPMRYAMAEEEHMSDMFGSEAANVEAAAKA
jgi:circadian clock protein KaiC